ncbi:RagB/SusD family nutrient uptake outer membrane protein [Flavivirga aquimarina]|uniref:RagB/SusD family nutrient uptake outer membrane protein n=1 Tax=Flavivirga aquimarina TaxID=2027862 RepID=A0ABT8W6I8_9FLAO|nr:RagB/SusD family nutrient uptake outer membrane protein [Flavivirga aquimarina]MDO5968716.1 RagB/SusD family nutrient uptake outer membrane protein [Flavivirga aquimarina]
MKNKKYLYVLTIAILFFSCEEYLDEQQQFEALDQNDVFSDIRLASDFLDGIYTRMVTEVSAIGSNPDILPAMVMSDEGYPGRMDSSVPTIYNSYKNSDYLGLMNRNPAINSFTTPQFVSRYTESWKGINTVNTFLANVDKINNGTEEEIDRLKGQAYLLRAYYYHLMTKRHGGLIYLKENLNLNESFDRERESYASNLADIIEDLDIAFDLLPVRWESENVGRPTKGFALALKSRVTLFAASPLVNTNNDQQAWVNAATAASDLINYANANGLYELADASNAINMDVDHNGADLFVSEAEELLPYRSIFNGPGRSKVFPNEVIFMESIERTAGGGNATNPLPRLYLTVGFDIAKGNSRPMNVGATANIVAKYETKNGLAIEDDPSYNPQEPFINRDPRFYNNILFHGVPWIHTTSGPKNPTNVADLARINENGVLGLDLHDPATPANRLWEVRNHTGYRIRKWVPNGYYLTGGSRGQLDFHVNTIVFRMAEVYLNYAEAANEAYGPSGTAPGSTLTALDAVNKIRNRVGMPNVNAMYAGSKELLRERIRNERAVELCFEGFRYDDMRRWKIAHLDENRKVKYLFMRWQGGESALYPTGFSYEDVEQIDLEKTFTDKNYWWPIPSSENIASPSFNQTEGW